MMKMFRSAAAVAVLLAAATPALADAPTPAPTGDVKARAAKRVDQVFAKLDTDKDGRLSRAEGAKGPKISKRFDQIDADHDGFISRAELSTAVEHRMARQAQKKPAPPQ